MTRIEKKITGTVLVGVGTFMLMMRTRVYSWGWGRMESAPAVLIVLLMISAILYVALEKKVLRYIIYALLAGLLVAVIMNVRVYFSGSLLTLVLTLAPVAAGIGLILSSVVADGRSGDPE